MRALEPTAGLARIAHSHGEYQNARALIASMLPQLETHAGNASNETLWVYHTCWQVLSSDGDPASHMIGANGRELLAKRAGANGKFMPSGDNETLLVSIWNAFGTPTPLS